jgi:hypothetical protein
MLQVCTHPNSHTPFRSNKYWEVSGLLLGFTFYRLLINFWRFEKLSCLCLRCQAGPRSGVGMVDSEETGTAVIRKLSELAVNIHSVTPLKTRFNSNISVGNTNLAITVIWWSVTMDYQSAQTNNKICKTPDNRKLVQVQFSHASVKYPRVTSVCHIHQAWESGLRRPSYQI